MWLEAALACAKDTAAAPRARALGFAGWFSLFQGDVARAGSLCKASLTLAREVGDKRIIASSLIFGGQEALEQGDPERAMPMIEEGLVLARDAGAMWECCCFLTLLAAAAVAQGDQLAPPRYSRSAWRSLGKPTWVSSACGRPTILAGLPCCAAIQEQCTHSCWKRVPLRSGRDIRWAPAI